MGKYDHLSEAELKRAIALVEREIEKETNRNEQNAAGSIPVQLLAEGLSGLLKNMSWRQRRRVSQNINRMTRRKQLENKSVVDGEVLREW